MSHPHGIQIGVATQESGLLQLKRHNSDTVIPILDIYLKELKIERQTYTNMIFSTALSQQPKVEASRVFTKMNG
jgi:hypothetical protein